jgi:peptidyl-prolyl cis-trans isomerase D
MQEIASVDQIFADAKAANDFLAFAKEHKGDDMGEVELSQLPIEVAKSFVNARVGDILKVSYGGAIQIFKVTKVAPKSLHYRLATLTYPVEPSKATVDAIYKSGSEFATKANGSVEKFKAAANEASIMTSQMNVQRGSRNIPGLANSVEVVRWANEAKVGDMSEIIKIGESYVVAIVTAVEESEYEPIEKATTKIKPVLMAQKKAAILKEKMQGATLEEIAANAGATVKEFSGVKTSSSFISGIGMEPSVIGTLEGVTAEGAGKLLPLVEGKNGVYALVVDEVAVEATQTVEAERVKAQAELESMAGGRAMWAAKEAANIEDNTVKFF